MHRWIDDGHLAVGDTVFRLFRVPAEADDGTLYLFKPRASVERYLRLADELRGGRVFEVGVFEGGSTAFLSAILEPEQLVAVDLTPEGNPALDRWIDDHDLGGRVHVHYGVDQSDRSALQSLLAAHFGDEPLDLVIDDASHLLGPSTATFNVLFPRLRPGGLYVIEDWSANLLLNQRLLRRPDRLAEKLRADPERLARRLAERPELLEHALRADPERLARRLQQQPELLGARPTEPTVGTRSATEPTTSSGERDLWRLVLRLALAVGCNADVMPDIEINQDFAALRRGPAELDPSTFDLAEYVGASPV